VITGDTLVLKPHRTQGTSGISGIEAIAIRNQAQTHLMLCGNDATAPKCVKKVPEPEVFSD